jgi:4-diphosphocytidyl-2C-methyl-D-erythritol kinase
MRLLARAKINWDLRILGRRPDGYHEIDTVMVSVDLADQITLEPADGLSLTCSDPALPCDERNLMVKAALALASAAGVPPKARMRVEKNIPSGGGMGGGSSDAATTLVGLNQLWDLCWPRERLAETAAQIGSDVAFFLYGGWCLCRGRGEVVEPFTIAQALPRARIFLVLPPFSVPTPSVYKALAAPPWDGKSGHRSLTEAEGHVKLVLVRLVDDSVCENWPENQLLRAAHVTEPRLVEIGQALEGLFPGRWQMSGSGAVHFVVPPSGITLKQAEEQLRQRLPGAWRLLETATVAS